MKDKAEMIFNRPTGLLLGLLTIILCVGNHQNSIAQNIGEIKAPLDSALEYAQVLYRKAQSRNSLIYTGRSYYDANTNVKGHQFFYDDYWEIGMVNYDNHVYTDIYLKYDIHKDLLLIENFNSNGYLSPIKLFSQYVKNFELHGYQFVRLEQDTVSGIKEGFYNLMYDSGTNQVFVKRRKEILKSTEISSVQEEFAIKNRIYICKDGIYHRVRKRKSILKVLEDHKKVVKRYIKQNQFTFKINPETQIVEVVKFYDSLS